MTAPAAVLITLALPLALRSTSPHAPQPGTSAPAVPSASASTDVRTESAPCTGGNLSAVLTRGTTPGQSALMMTNVGTVRCTLADWPILVTVESGSAKTVPLVEVPADAAANEELPATIDPGEQAHATIVASLSCHGGQNPVSYSNLAVASLDARVPVAGPPLVATCPIGISPWYRLVGSG